MKKFHGAGFHCDMCGKSLATKTQLDIHKKTNHEDTTWLQAQKDIDILGINIWFDIYKCIFSLHNFILIHLSENEFNIKRYTNQGSKISDGEGKVLYNQVLYIITISGIIKYHLHKSHIQGCFFLRTCKFMKNEMCEI